MTVLPLRSWITPPRRVRFGLPLLGMALFGILFLGVGSLALTGCAGGGQKSTRPASGTGTVAPASGSSSVLAIPIGFPTGPDHYLGEEMAPTPYTAAQIRDACPPGRVNRFAITRTEGKFISVQRFVETSAEGAKIQQLIGRRTSDDPKRNPPPQSQEVVLSWVELQSHASYPADKTQISRERVKVQAGEYDCWRFTVEEGLTTTFYWFPVHLAGPPVRTEIYRGNERILTMELIDLTMN